MSRKFFLSLVVLLTLILAISTYLEKRGRREHVTNFEECAKAGNPLMESFPRICRSKSGRLFTENASPASEPSIRVFYPLPETEISSPLTISGEAKGTWFFEGSFSGKLLDSREKEIGRVVLQAEGEWMTENFVPWTGAMTFSKPSGKTGLLILEKANAADLPQKSEEYSIPIFFGSVSGTTTLQVYFGNTIKDLDGLHCEKTYSVPRIVAGTSTPLRAAILELLKGPTSEEKSEGFHTEINSGVILEKASIINGIAYLDFNESLQFEVAGSCRVTAIESEIKETAKQFPGVKSVVIRINGKSGNEILQP